MAAKQEPVQFFRSSYEKKEPTTYLTLKAGEVIYMGTLAMRVSGNDYVETYVAGTNNAILMGVARATYDNSAGVGVKTYADDNPMVFERGVFKQFTSDGTITFDDVGVEVGLKSNWEIGTTVAANECGATLIAIDQRSTNGDTVYVVDIHQSGPV